MPNLWEDNLMGFVRKEDWLKVGSLVPTRPNDPVDALLGDNKTDNLVARWESLAAEYNVPLMAQFHGFDTEAQKTFRVPVDNHLIEKGLIKVKIDQSERLRALRKSGIVGDTELYNYVMDDGARLADQVITRTKVAKNELLSSGKVTIKENNLDLTVDYGVPASQTGYALDLSEDADVLAQIQAIIDDANENGQTLNGMITSGKVFTQMRRNQSIQKAINGAIMSGQLVSKNALEGFLESEYGINNVVITDLTYGVPGGIDPATGRPRVSKKRYFPENKVTFFATNTAGKLGIGLWGDSPEADAAKFYEVSKATGISPYVYIMQWMEKDPTVLWTKASSLFMPVLYNPYSLYIATVADNGLNKVTVAGAPAETDFWGTTASQLQSSIAVANGGITGTLNYISSGQIVNDWGAGNFIGLKFTDIDPNADKCYVGLQPSVSSGMVALDPDGLALLKVTNKNIQKLKVVSVGDGHETVQTFDLSGLTCNAS